MSASDPNYDQRTDTPGVYKRRKANGGFYFRVLTRPDGKRKVMHRFETYDAAVAFKAHQPSKKNPRKPRRLRNLKTTYRNGGVAYLTADPCAYCDKPGREVDHIVPVAEGGTNDWTNLTASCWRCNSEKRTKSLLHFLLQKKGRAGRTLDAVPMSATQPLHELLGY